MRPCSVLDLRDQRGLDPHQVLSPARILNGRTLSFQPVQLASKLIGILLVKSCSHRADVDIVVCLSGSQDKAADPGACDARLFVAGDNEAVALGRLDFDPVTGPTGCSRFFAMMPSRPCSLAASKISIPSPSISSDRRTACGFRGNPPPHSEMMPPPNSEN